MTPLPALHTIKHTCKPGRNRAHAVLRTFPHAESLDTGIHRGELRLAAEVVVAHGQGRNVPQDAYERAMSTLQGLAL